MEVISKEDAVALIKAEMDKIRTHSLVDGTARINLRLAKNIIEDMPTIDIVRCKECRYCKRKRGTFKGEPIIFYRCTENNRDVESDDYCSWGERSK